ncbi:MAG TPA: MMPL family transporter, partial [Micromonosporaceae bacterium]
MTENRGPIAAVGRACFRNRWWVLAIWVVLAVAGVMASGRVFNGLSTEPGANQLESVQAYNVLQDQSKVGDQITGEVTGVDPAAASTKSAVTAAATDLAALPGVHSVATPFGTGGTSLIARDGSGLLVDVTLNDLSDKAEQTAVDAVNHRLDTLQASLRSGGATHATIARGGSAILNQQVNDQVEHDLGLAEELSLPITLVVLIFVFGGLVAAGLPIIAAILSVFGAMLALLGFEKITTIDQNATIVVTLLGLGLSIDYGLLLVARYREELAAGFEGADAVGRAWATAGRTILFSALTVAGSLAGLTVFGVTSMTALGTAGVSIAAIAMLVSLTATAAMLGIARKRIKAARRRVRTDDETGFFAGLARVVQRRPIVTVVATAAVLLIMG